jgi:acyl-CoA reductase-like NAD-dependent aldehyde dehydrogenase
MINKAVILPIIYIVVWFYELFTFEIPTLSIHLGDFLSMTLWQIVGVMLFLVPCTVPFIILAFFAAIALLDL